MNRLFEEKMRTLLIILFSVVLGQSCSNSKCEGNKWGDVYKDLPSRCLK